MMTHITLQYNVLTEYGAFVNAVSLLKGLLAASPEIRAGNWRTGFPQVYHALDKLLASGEGQEKSGGWGGSSRVDGVGVGCTIVTVLLDNKRRQARTLTRHSESHPIACCRDVVVATVLR